jgi:hypothetical protein
MLVEIKYVTIVKEPTFNVIICLKLDIKIYKYVLHFKSFISFS